MKRESTGVVSRGRVMVATIFAVSVGIAVPIGAPAQEPSEEDGAPVRESEIERTDVSPFPDGPPPVSEEVARRESEQWEREREQSSLEERQESAVAYRDLSLEESQALAADAFSSYFERPR